MALKGNGGGHRKILRVTCKANTLVELDDLEPLQSDLKDLDDDSFGKLKRSIVEHGISFPFFIWRDKKTNYTLDGHQRDKALCSLREDGFEVPPLPADLIEAKNKSEAAKKILLITSQYGRITNDGLADFLNDNRIRIESIIDTVQIPGIDLPNFLELMAGPKSPEEFQTYDENIDTEHKCPKCGYEWSGKQK